MSFGRLRDSSFSITVLSSFPHTVKVRMREVRGHVVIRPRSRLPSNQGLGWRVTYSPLSRLKWRLVIQYKDWTDPCRLSNCVLWVETKHIEAYVHYFHQLRQVFSMFHYCSSVHRPRSLMFISIFYPVVSRSSLRITLRNPLKLVVHVGI